MILRSTSVAILALCISHASLSFANSVHTRIGNVYVKSNGLSSSELMVNGKIVKKFRTPVTILAHHDTKSNLYILLGDSGYGEACPQLERIIDISRNNIISTKLFGTCSDDIKLKASGKEMKITMPGPENRGRYTYYYNGGNIVRKTKEESVSPVDIVKIGNFQSVVELQGYIKISDGRPYLVLNHKTKFVGPDNEIYLKSVQIACNEGPKPGVYGLYKVAITMPMAGPIITKFFNH